MHLPNGRWQGLSGMCLLNNVHVFTTLTTVIMDVYLLPDLRSCP